MQKNIRTTVAGLGVLAIGLGLWNWSYAAADAAAGQKIYGTYCVACHGASGKGDGPAGQVLTPKPRDLTLAKAKGDDYLKKVITQGGAANGLSAAMPPWGAALKPADVDAVIAYIKTLK